MGLRSPKPQVNENNIKLPKFVDCLNYHTQSVRLLKPIF
jgi:hypothetical protein